MRDRATISVRELVKTISVLRERINAHRAVLAGNELMTRYALVDPLLVALGWDLSDPDTAVLGEDAGDTYYILGRNAMAVEAKRLGENLDAHAEDLALSIQDKGVRYGVLTNGQKWRMYDSGTATKSPEMEFDVTDSEGVVIYKAVRLYSSVVLDGIRQEPTRVESLHDVGGERLDPDRRDALVPLPNLQYVKGMAPPRYLACPDKRIRLNSWIDLLAGVAGWLVGNRYLDKSHCPVLMGAKNSVLNTRPVHPNGKPYRHKRKAGYLYLNTNVDPVHCIRYATKMVKVAGLEPGGFGVHFGDSQTVDAAHIWN